MVDNKKVVSAKIVQKPIISTSTKPSEYELILTYKGSYQDCNMVLDMLFNNLSSIK